MRYLYLFIPILVMTACFAPQPEPVPQWVEQPPLSTQQSLYGVSVAETKTKALASAAGGIASAVFEMTERRLEQTTGNTPSLSKAMKGVLASLDYSEAILVKQGEIAKPGASEAETKKDTAVLVTIPRKRITVQLQQQLEARTLRLKSAITAADGMPPFYRLAQLGKCVEERYSLLAETALIETLDPERSVDRYRSFADECESAYNELKFASSASVISDANAIGFVDPVKKALIAEGINPNGAEAESSAAISLMSDRQQKKVGNQYKVTTRITAITKADGKQLAESEHYYSAKSSEGYENAERMNAEALARSIRSEGLFHVLGF